MVDPGGARARASAGALATYVVGVAPRRRAIAGIQFNAVVETNTAAVHLWQALGFEIVGTVPGAFRSADARPGRAARDVPAAGLTRARRACVPPEDVWPCRVDGVPAARCHVSWIGGCHWSVQPGWSLVPSRADPRLASAG